MKRMTKSFAVTLSFFVFMMCLAPYSYAAAAKKGSSIEIRMTKEVPIEAQPKSSESWVKRNKWWLLLGLAVVGGAAAAAGGGGGGGGSDPSSPGSTVDPPATSSDTGSVTVGW